MRCSIGQAIIAAAVMFLLTISPLFAQTDIGLTWYLIRDDNAFKNRTLNDDWINTVALYTGHSFSRWESTFRVYYSGDYATFSHYTDRQNNSHRAGIAVQKRLYELMTLNAGTYARIRRHKDEYNYYNADTYYAYTNLRIDPDLLKSLTGGFTYQRTYFKNFSDIDSREYQFFGKYQQFFQNRMSLTGELTFGSKNYVNQSLLQFFGFTPGTRFNAPRYMEEPVIATMFSGAVNVGKSLTNKTGVNLTGGGQWYIGDPIQVFDDGVYYYTENDLYDDPYGYENWFAALTLTRQFGIGFQGKIGAEYQEKDYTGTPALDYDGNLLNTFRKDTRKEYFLLINKDFETSWKYPGKIGVFFRLLIRDNQSNDPYYDYTDHLSLVGFSISK